MSYADSATVRRLADMARSAGWIGLDVEFNSERTYFPRLALVQAVVDDFLVLIDPVKNPPDLKALAEVFADEEVVKVLHSPDQDLPILARAFGRTARRVFDTQIAAALAGVGEGSQIGYAWLVEDLVGVKLAKGARRTDWLRRPLSVAQVDYALDDVRHLEALWRSLSQRLEDLGRMDWALEDFARFEEPGTYAVDPRRVWTRCKGASGVTDGSDRAVLQEVAAWREGRAVRADRPRRWLLEDRALIDLARAHPRPGSPAAVVTIAELTDRQTKSWAQELVDCVARGARNEPPPIAGPGRLPKAEEGIVRGLMEIVKERARELGVSAPSLTTTNELRSIVLHGREADVRVLGGWRRPEIGDALLAGLSPP